MKIKTTKKLNLPEFIQYVWEGNLPLFKYLADGDDSDDRYIRFLNNGVVKVIGGMSKDDTFTVEVEEELTEDTEIHGATFVYYDELKREIKPFRYADVTSPSLKHIIQTRPDTVALAVFKGKQLIWTKEHGIPESGVLEVEADVQ